MEKDKEQPLNFLDIRGGNIITGAQKYRNSVAANTVPVTKVPHTVTQESLFLVVILRRRSVALRSLTIPLSLACCRHPVFLSITTFFPEHHKVIGGGKLNLFCYGFNQLSACT